MKKKVALIGMRGLVGSVLMQRMHEENDFEHFEAHFFSSTQQGKKTELRGFENDLYEDAHDLETLKKYPIILSCQGGAYTEKIHPALRKTGWAGYWIDAASTLRMDGESLLILDPINGEDLKAGLQRGIKNYVGSNCTVSLLLLALQGLIKEDLIEWISFMTYQAASGAGAEAMRELLLQMQEIGNHVASSFKDPAVSILKLERRATAFQNSGQLTTKATIKPLAGNLLPWIDTDLGRGISREEAKMPQEAHKLLGHERLHLDGLCVRVGALRSHSQALTMKLKRPCSEEELIHLLKHGNEWIRLIPNTRDATLNALTPACFSGSLEIGLGRLRKLNLAGGEFWTAFTIGDQLLWGAAEPLRRFLRILLEESKEVVV